VNRLRRLIRKFANLNEWFFLRDNWETSDNFVVAKLVEHESRGREYLVVEAEYADEIKKYMLDDCYVSEKELIKEYGDAYNFEDINSVKDCLLKELSEGISIVYFNDRNFNKRTGWLRAIKEFEIPVVEKETRKPRNTNVYEGYEHELYEEEEELDVENGPYGEYAKEYVEDAELEPMNKKYHEEKRDKFRPYMKESPKNPDYDYGYGSSRPSPYGPRKHWFGDK
jgi:hypothetical protein